MYDTGIYTLANGQKYKGGWVDNQKHGRGSMICADDNIYNCEWRKGIRHGNGTCTLDSRNKSKEIVWIIRNTTGSK